MTGLEPQPRNLPGEVDGTPDQPSALHSIATVAQRLDVSEKSVRRYIGRGELPAYRIGGQIRIGEADLQNFPRYCRMNMSNTRRK
jgi:excisionase family DNA binding protein